MVKSFAFLVVFAEAAICTGTKDLVVSELQCYHGSGIADFPVLPGQDVYVIIADFGANSGGHMEITSDGLDSFTCSNRVFTKSGLQITTDLSDCLHGITIPEIDFCSDQDAVKVTVRVSYQLRPIIATLSRVACSSRGFCSGTNDPVVTAPQCYRGYPRGYLGATPVNVKIDDFGANGAGHMEITMDWPWVPFTCSNKGFTKSGLKITTDLSDCLPDGITIPEIDFCSDQDAVMVNTLGVYKADGFSRAPLSRVACSDFFPNCTGTKDLVVSEPQCYHGVGHEFGGPNVTQDVYVKIADFGANGGGHMEVTGDGMVTFRCSNRVFAKSGLKITTDLSDCLRGLISEIDFCSDQDAFKVTINIHETVNATLSRVACSSFGFCSGTNDTVVTAPQCYRGYLFQALTSAVLGNVKINDLGANGAGHMEMEMAGVTCSNKSFTKSGLKITTDLSDCLPDDLTIPEIDFCSDQDAVMVTAKADGDPLLALYHLKRVACSDKDCYSAQSEDDCNKVHCEWVPWMLSCEPCCGAGLALSQVLTSRPLKQYMEEPVQQHAALRDEDCLSAQSEDDCNNKGVGAWLRCCWSWSGRPTSPMCLPCGANDASQEGTHSTFPTLV